MSSKLETLYNFKEYPAPKTLFFKVETNKYGPNGWIQKIEKYNILGETDDWYVYRLKESGHGEWTDKGSVVQHRYILPIGIHKSRLVKCLQLTLFDN